MIEKELPFERIYILGYMGSGKSTLAKELAKELNCNYLDLDIFIKQETGEAPSEWIKRKGEISFRAVERAALLKVSSTFNGIIASGGGTPCYFDNMDVMLSTGITAYLFANPKELAYRLRNAKTQRPLLSDIKPEDLVEFIAKHLFERAPFYSRAKIQWKATEKNVKKWAKEIHNNV